MNIKKIFSLLKMSFKSWKDDKVPQLSAALSYYTLFSLAPLLVIILGIVGFFFGDEAARGQIFYQIKGTFGEEGAAMIQTMIQSSRDDQKNIIISIVGFITLILGASGVFGQLHDALNIIWNVQPKPKQSIWNVIKTRFLTFSMILVIGFLLIVSLVVSAGISAVAAYFDTNFPIPIFTIELINSTLSIVVMTLLFGCIYKFLPDVKITWKDVFVGAFITAVLFTLGKLGLGFYLGRSGATSTYGAAGSLVIVLLWTYYSTQIMFFGAEFTKNYATHYGSRIKPDKNSYAVENEPTPLDRWRKTNETSGQTKRPYELIPYGATIIGFILGIFMGAKKEKKKK